MQIYVGNISYLVTEQDLTQLFSKFGKVEKVKIMNNTETGQNSGWAFVTMTNDEEGAKAVELLNLKNFRGRKIKVNQYRPKSKNPNKPKFGQWINH